MATNYPSGYDSLNNPAASDPLDSSGTPHSSQHTNANDAIEAIQATLGLSPQGSYTTVSERIYEMGNESSVAAAAASAAAAADSESAAAASATSAASSAASVDATATTATEFRQFAADGSVLSNLPARVHPAEQLLKQAVWWIDAAHSSASGQSIKNLGWGGSALDAQCGSTGSADSNDPKYLDWQGENYIYLPGVAGNYLSVPDEAALDITGDIDIRVKVAQDSVSGTEMALVSKDNGTVYTYTLRRLAGGTLNFLWADSGGGRQVTSSTSPISVAGEAQWLRVTLDVDNGAGGHEVKFWTSPDGSSWSQVGTTQNAGAFTTSILASTYTTYIGSRTGTVANATGSFHRAQVLNGIDGTPVLDVDCSQITSGADTSFTALTGQTVTINRSTSGRKTVGVVHPRWLFGSDDYMEVPARWVDASSGGLFLPGVSGNYASTPDSAALSVTGDITIDVHIGGTGWMASTSWAMVGKEHNSNSRTYMFLINGSGYLRLGWSEDGVSPLTATSTIGYTGTEEAKWFRVTMDADVEGSDADITFYTSDDGVTWTQLGATVNHGSATSIADTSSQLEIGSTRYGTLNIGGYPVYRARIYASADGSGSPVFDADFTGQAALATTFTEDSTNSATVTVNTSGSGYVATLVPASGYVQPTGVANYQPSSYSLLDFGATQDFTAVVFARRWGAGTNGGFLQKKPVTGSAAGWSLTETRMAVSDGGVQQVTASVSWTSGTAHLQSGGREGTTTLWRALDGGARQTTAIPSTNVDNAVATRVGTFSNGTYYADMEFTAAAIWRRALTAGEIATLTDYYKGRG